MSENSGAAIFLAGTVCIGSIAWAEPRLDNTDEFLAGIIAVGSAANVVVSAAEQFFNNMQGVMPPRGNKNQSQVDQSQVVFIPAPVGEEDQLQTRYKGSQNTRGLSSKEIAIAAIGDNSTSVRVENTPRINQSYYNRQPIDTQYLLSAKNHITKDEPEPGTLQDNYSRTENNDSQNPTRRFPSPIASSPGGNNPNPIPPDPTDPKKERDTKDITNKVVERLEREFEINFENLNKQASYFDPIAQSKFREQLHTAIIKGEVKQEAVRLTIEENKKHRNILAATEISTVSAIAAETALRNSGILENQENLT